MTSILAVPGSLRAASTNRLLLEAARELAPADVVIELWDGLRAVPAFDEDAEGAPGEAVLDLRTRLAAADGVLIATPEYNQSIPGALKNALDWASRPYGVAEIVGKPVAVMGASPSPFGATWAQAELRKVLAASGADVLEQGVAVGKAATRFDETGSLVDAAVRADVEAVVGALVARARDTARGLVAA